MGFPIIEPIRRIWDGGRDLEVVCAGCDPQTKHLVQAILSQVIESPGEALSFVGLPLPFLGLPLPSTAFIWPPAAFRWPSAAFPWPSAVFP